MLFDKSLDPMDPSDKVLMLRKEQLEMALRHERSLEKIGYIKEDNPLDMSERFEELCEAARRGDLKVCQEKITEGADINARDVFDCTPLILASLCGHFEVVQLLLDSGALCERDTFQGERALYNALNDKIRNLLLQYDYTKSTNPLQPFAAHLSSLLTRDQPQTSDIVVTNGDVSFYLHKFILAARSPYFQKKLSANPGITSLKLPNTIPPQAFSAAIKYIYLGDTPRDLNYGPDMGFTESEVFAGMDRVAKHLELPSLIDNILDSGDKRLARQRKTEEVYVGRDQIELWFLENVIKNKMVVNTDVADEVTWSRDNPIFADVILRADEDIIDGELQGIDEEYLEAIEQQDGRDGIPVDASSYSSGSSSWKRKSVLFPVHRAMLLRSEFFSLMFSSGFREAHMSDNLQIIPVDCRPEILEIILTFMYTEKSDFGLDVAVDVLFAADLLLMERLKTKAGVVISTLGNGNLSMRPPIPKPMIKPAPCEGTQLIIPEEEDEEPVDVYEVIRAAWTTRVQRLEEFAARYLAYRLEAHIDCPEFSELIIESSKRVKNREETDTIVLVDDLRYYLSERFRLRFEELGLHEVLDQLDLSKDGNCVLGVTNTESQDDQTEEKDDDAQSEQQQQQQQEVKEANANGDAETDAENSNVVLRTLDGRYAGDEFARDAMNYRILSSKLGRLLAGLHLDI